MIKIQSNSSHEIYKYQIGYLSDFNGTFIVWGWRSTLKEAIQRADILTERNSQFYEVRAVHVTETVYSTKP